MRGLSLLPAGLIVLLLSSPTLAAEPTTPADPFYHVAKHAKRPPEPPVCCLRPLESSENFEPAEEILSFEEWKSKQEEALRREQGQNAGVAKERAKSNASPAASDSSQESTDEAGANSEGASPLEPPTPPPPHFRVPLTDRFNYASLDCSARVHYAHRSARSASSLLSSKKDRYMLSPCNTPGEDKFVVVELCEDIRIDTVQLANFEFFSGVFKDFSVSVARTYTTDPEGWTSAGTYRAKNIRGIQSFHPPTSLRDFYRFIRIDFHSHYGNEYYCPVSLLRVYGLTHLEQWKWEVWEAEYKAKMEAQASMRRIAPAPDAPAPTAGAAAVEEDGQLVKSASETVPASSYGDSSVQMTSDAAERTVPSEGEVKITSNEGAKTGGSPTSNVNVEAPRGSTDESTAEGSLKSGTSVTSSSEAPISNDNPSSPSNSSSIPSHSPPISSDSLRNDASSDGGQSSDPSSLSNQKSNSTGTATASASSTPMPTVVAQETRAAPALSATGESIYRTIMTRLSMLEANSSLYLRYVEEQTRSLRDALTRLEEDVGRLEGLSKATTQSFQKIINEMDRQRRRLEREHGELQTRVDFLTDEVILEKRLGIAQLCLLLMVLVFLALTRGSRGEPFMTMTSQLSSGKRDALREWGRRHLSSFSSGERTSKLKNGSSSSHVPVPEFVKSPIPIRPDKVKFPTKLNQEGEDGDHTPRRSSSTSEQAVPPLNPPTKVRTLSEIRTPHPRQLISSSHAQSYHRPRTPTSSSGLLYAQATRSDPDHGSSPGVGLSMSSIRPRIRRSSSHSTPGPVMGYTQSMREGRTGASASAAVSGDPPLSVKKWAKSAHWHEIRRKFPKKDRLPAGDVSASISNSGLVGSTSTSGRSNPVHNSDQENEQTVDSPRDPAFVSSPRAPLSASPIQNRSRRQPEFVADDSPAKSQFYRPNGGPAPNIIDLDTESENWEDTDADAEVDD